MIYTPISVTTRAISEQLLPSIHQHFPLIIWFLPLPPLSLPVLRRREMEDNNKNVWDKRITPEEDEEEEGEEEGVGGERRRLLKIWQEDQEDQQKQKRPPKSSGSVTSSWQLNNRGEIITIDTRQRLLRQQFNFICRSDPTWKPPGFSRPINDWKRTRKEKRKPNRRPVKSKPISSGRRWSWHNQQGPERRRCNRWHRRRITQRRLQVATARRVRQPVRSLRVSFPRSVLPCSTRNPLDLCPLSPDNNTRRSKADNNK